MGRNQKTSLLNRVSEKAVTIQQATQRMRMLPVNQRVAKRTTNLEKTKTLPRKHQKTIFNFDATFAKVAKVRISDVVIATALGNQKTPLLNRVSEKPASPRMQMLLVNQRVAKEAANLEKTKTLPQKHQKTILNFGATFAKVAKVSDVVVMATALRNQKTPQLNPASEKAATIPN